MAFSDSIFVRVFFKERIYACVPFAFFKLQYGRPTQKKKKASAFDTPLDYLLIGFFFSWRKFMIADAIFSSTCFTQYITTKSQF